LIFNQLRGNFDVDADSLRHPLENRLSNIRQLKYGGTNAEVGFSFAQDRLVFQSTRPPFQCDQIFTMALDGKRIVFVSDRNATARYEFDIFIANRIK